MNRKLLIAIIIIVVVLVSAGGYYSTILLKPKPTKLAQCQTQSPFGKGDLTLPIVDKDGLTNRTLTLSDYSCHVILLEFMAPWCDHCENVEPAMKSLYAQYSPRGVVFLAVAGQWGKAVVTYNGQDESVSPGDVAKYIRQYGATSTFVYESSARTYDLYSVQALPTFVIIAKNGTVTTSLTGERNFSTLSALLDPLT